MTKQKPENIEELREWIEEHKDDGKINGEPIIQAKNVEMRSGFVPGNLYDEALLVGAALGYNKSQIATAGFFKLLSSPTKDLLESRLLEVGSYDAKTEFRAYIPIGMQGLILRLRDDLNWNTSQIMTVALSLFVADSGIKKVYQQFVDQKASESGLTVPEVETRIFDCWRLQARVKRLELSEKAGKFVSDRKLS